MARTRKQLPAEPFWLYANKWGKKINPGTKGLSLNFISKKKGKQKKTKTQPKTQKTKHHPISNNYITGAAFNSQLLKDVWLQTNCLRAFWFSNLGV